MLRKYIFWEGKTIDAILFIIAKMWKQPKYPSIEDSTKKK